MQNTFKRVTCALLTQALMTAHLASAANAIWPDPMPEPVYPSAPLRVFMQPNFQAPSASHCERGIETREVSDGQLRPRPPAIGNPWLRDRLPEAYPSGASAAAHKAAVPAPAAAPRAESRVADTNMRIAPRSQTQQSMGPVTAGMVDDNAAFADYLAFRARNQQVPHRERDVRERYLLEVSDTQGRTVPDAEVVVQAANGASTWLRTDAGGKAWIHPDAFDPGKSSVYEVTARQGTSQLKVLLQRGQKSALEMRLEPGQRIARTKLDLVFLVDATGSMGDEIDKLKSSLRSITAEVAALPSHPDLCLGLVAYRDRGDEFFVRSHDLTNDVNAFQGVLNALQAGGGGDEPEAMNEALHEAVHHLHWRGDQTTRMVILVADAPPHLDYGGPQYDDDMMAALGKGIKLMSVGASGLNKQGEYIQRQMAQYTGGRFIFLTYADASNPASGPGRETVHDVRNYSVQTLDKLVVRLVREELDKLPKS